MCGIIGIFNHKDAKKLAKKGLSKILYRGKDSNGLFSSENCCIGHCLHSVVNFVEQPFKGKGVLIVNCELYNWEELNDKYKFKARNDSELLFMLLEKKGVSKIKEILDELDGVYSFCYWIDDKVYVARDIIGVKPLWFSKYEHLGFASEKKALKEIGMFDAEELNPRKILVYDVKKNKVEFIERDFLKITPELKCKYEKIKKELTGLVVNSISKRIPDQKFGILFSGGIDSGLIAHACKELGVDFTCYTAALKEKGMGEAEDMVYAKKVADKLGFRLKTKTISLKETEKYLKKVVPLIEDSNVVKVGVGLTFYVACEMAKKDGIKVIFSGLGSEELFAGYERHRKSDLINKECLSGVIKIYERDLYRDDVIAMANNLELRLPFLDKKLTSYALKIPAKYKIKDGLTKVVLRDVAVGLGYDKEFASRRKKAAQYGSKFDRAIAKLAKRKGFNLKSEYLRTFYPEVNLKLGVLFSSGKDSCYAMHVMKRQNYEISCLITLKSKNKDSYMFHTPAIELAEVQAKAMELPIIEQETAGVKEKELADLKKALAAAKKEHKIEGVVTGALFSKYQRERIEKVADSLGLKIFSPLWHMDQETELKSLVREGFDVIISSIAGYGMETKDIGKRIDDKMISKLRRLKDKIGFNVAGEGGEFESFVLDGPMFKKRLEIVDSQRAIENECTGRMLIKKIKLVDKK